MKEPTEIEIEGMLAAGESGGRFLEELGKTDVSVMTGDEWMTFIERIVRVYEEKCMALYGDPPF